MGNGMAKQLGLTNCCSNSKAFVGDISRRHPDVIMIPSPAGFGHSFCYIRTDYPSSNSSATTFSSISGASISANTSTPLSTSLTDSYTSYSAAFDKAPSAFESSGMFFSVPLEPLPHNSGSASSPVERAFISGPIERALFSGSLDRPVLERSLSHGQGVYDHAAPCKPKRRSLASFFRKTIRRTISRVRRREPAPAEKREEDAGLEGPEFPVCSDQVGEGLQWAQGRAGEDRMHVVISEEGGWVFVGIYDGFNGPDAPDFLISNLYSTVHEELKDHLGNDGTKEGA